MARRKRSKRKDETFAGWVWMLFGLAIGLSVAVAIYFRGPVASGPVVVSESAPAETAAVPDRDTPVAANQPQEELTEEEARFEFYELLKTMRVEVEEFTERKAGEVKKTEAVQEAGTYVLMAGSFSKRGDAENRRAEVALQGIQSEIFRARLDGNVYHRVIVGPTEDVDELNLMIRQLNDAGIDVLPMKFDQ